jgi:glycosidase
VHRLPSVLDFAFRIGIGKTLAGDAGTSLLARLYLDDALYEGGAKAALRLPTFVSNHDDGRFAAAARRAFPSASDDEILQRVILAHALLFTLRGVPVVYAGDEQGFAGLGGDQAARQDLFASQVASYNNDSLVGSTSTTAISNFNPSHPLYQAIAELAALRTHHAALRRGMQIVRNFSDVPGVFAVSRIDPASGQELVVAFNTSTAPLTGQMQINTRSTHFTALHGRCTATATVPGSYHIELAPLSFAICAATSGQ